MTPFQRGKTEMKLKALLEDGGGVMNAKEPIMHTVRNTWGECRKQKQNKERQVSSHCSSRLVKV